MDPNKQKLTGLNAINTTLSRGSYGDQVKALQQYLISLGYSQVKADGGYGPVTEQAVKQYQLDNGLKGDGTWGPDTQHKALTLGNSPDPAGNPGTGKAPDDPSNMFNQDTGKLNDKFVPKTQEELDRYYNAYAAAHPVFAHNDPDTLAYAAETGDFSSLRDPQGQPFSDLQQKDAMNEADRALAPGFKAEKQYDTANTIDSLDKTKKDYEDYLATSKENFQTDKTNLDQDAADKGVLFSGGRYEKERKLIDSFDRNQATNLRGVVAGLGGTLRDYQYAYGKNAVSQPSLSQYYQVGGNTYNAHTAQSGIGAAPIKDVYNAGAYNFQGTKVNANKAAASVRAANLLKNKGNKLLSTGYNNQF